MALSDENQNWVLEEIRKAVQPNGWKKFADRLRYWGVLGVVVTGFLALVALVVTVGVLAANLINQESEFRGKTDARLTNIEGVLKEIKGQITKQSLATHAALPLADFSASLSDLSTSVSAARKQDLKVPPKIVDDLSKKMLAIDANTPDFWPVTGELISYRSVILVGSLQNWGKTFPPCPGTVDLDSTPGATVQPADPTTGEFTGPPQPLLRLGNQDCYVELDGKKVSKWDCKRCLVKYSGGPLSLRDVHFEDCLFVFDLRSKPLTPDGAFLSKTLLASTSQNITIPSG